MKKPPQHFFTPSCPRLFATETQTDRKNKPARYAVDQKQSRGRKSAVERTEIPVPAFRLPAFSRSRTCTTGCQPPQSLLFRLAAVRRLMPNIGWRFVGGVVVRLVESSWSSRGYFVWKPPGSRRTSR